jgi:hypothetical protein
MPQHLPLALVSGSITGIGGGMRGPHRSRKLIVAQGRREQMPVVLAVPNGRLGVRSPGPSQSLSVMYR